MDKQLCFMMKTIQLFLGMFFLCFPSLLRSQVGVGTTTPQAALEINSATAGFLIPRVQLTALTIAAPVINPQSGALVAGTLVYNLGPVAPGNLAAGFYYWNGIQWTAIAGAAPTANAWLITGNTGTNPANNFIGNTDNVDFRVRTNNAERFTFSANGRFRAHNDGSAAEPVYSWSYASNGTNMGMYRAGAGILGFSTAGTQRMAIDATGNIGVNTAPVTTDRLSVGTTVAGQSAIGASSNSISIFTTTTNGASAALLGRNLAYSGAGIIGSASALTSYLAGVGGAFNGNGYGALGFASHTGVGGLGNGLTVISTHPDGAGVAGRGAVGVYGSTPIATGWAGYFAGDVYANYSYAIDFYLWSDERLKSDVKPIMSSLDLVTQLKPYSYTKNITSIALQNTVGEDEAKLTEESAGGEEYGFMAQDIEKILPILVKTKPMKMAKNEIMDVKSVNYIGLIPVMVKAIQEQQQIIELQEARLKKLEALIEKLLQR